MNHIEQNNNLIPLRKMIIFQYNAELGEYQELEVENNAQIHDLLVPEFIILFVNQIIRLYYMSISKLKLCYFF